MPPCKASTCNVPKSSTSAPIEEALNAILWALQLAATDDSTQNDVVKLVMGGAKQMLAHKTTKKYTYNPINYRKKLVEEFAQEDVHLHDSIIVILCLIGFTSFRRYSELVASDLHVYPDHMEIL